MKIDMNSYAHNIYEVECIGSDGRVKWRETVHNMVVNEGGDDILTQYWKGSSYTAAHYMGLTGTTPTFALADTLASHSGWTEVTPYTGSRPSVSWGTAASKSLAGTAVSFSITATATVGGAFLATVASGTTGTLVGGGAFSADRSVANGDTLNVTPTASV